MRLPFPLDLVHRRGLSVFDAPMSANLVVHRGPGGAGDWDGLCHLLWRETALSGWTSRVWPCVTRPGLRYVREPMNPKGTATLEPGQYRRSHRRGLHHGRPALVQVRPVTVRRSSGLDVGLFGVNVHDVADPNDLAGCMGLAAAHRDELLAAFDRLAAVQGPDISLTLVEG